MKALRISYVTPNGKVDFKEYNAIKDFIGSIESGDTAILACHHVSAKFFENPSFLREFPTVKELYEYCARIFK